MGNKCVGLPILLMGTASLDDATLPTPTSRLLSEPLQSLHIELHNGIPNTRSGFGLQFSITYNLIYLHRTGICFCNGMHKRMIVKKKQTRQEALLFQPAIWFATWRLMSCPVTPSALSSSLPFFTFALRFEISLLCTVNLCFLDINNLLCGNPGLAWKWDIISNAFWLRGLNGEE